MAPQSGRRNVFLRKRTYLVFLPVIVFTLFVALPTNIRMQLYSPSSAEPERVSLEDLVEEASAERREVTQSEGSSKSGMEKRVMEQLAGKFGGQSEGDVLKAGSLFPAETEEEGLEQFFVRGAVEQVPRGKVSLQMSNLALDPGDIETDLPIATHKWTPAHVFVISITRDTKQLRAIDAKLHSVGMKYTLVLAPDSTKIDLGRYRTILSEDRVSVSRGSAMKPNEVDELLAHLELWAHVVAHQLRYTIVLEEDAVLKDSFKEDLERSLKQLNLLRVEHTGYFFDVCMLGRDHYTHTEAKLTANIIEARSSAGAHAYLLSLAGAFRLLENVRLDDPLNEAMWQVHQLYWLALNPAAVETTMYKCEDPPCRQMPEPSASPSQSTRGLQAYAATLHLTKEGECGGTAWECLEGKIRGWVKQRRQQRAPWPPVPIELEEWPVYVMNMDRETRRMDDLKKRLSEHGFGKVQRARAVDMGSTDLATFDHLIAKDKVSVTRAGWNAAAKFLSKGDIGCALSHYMIWSDIVVKNVPYALVLEDDIDFVPEFSGDFERNVKELREFVASGHEMSRFDICFVGREPIVQPWFERPLYTPHVKFAGMSWTTHSYIISLPGARKLVKKFFVDDPIDAIWWRIPRIKFLTFDPLLTFQRRDDYGSTAGEGGDVRGVVNPWR